MRRFVMVGAVVAVGLGMWGCSGSYSSGNSGNPNSPTPPSDPGVVMVNVNRQPTAFRVVESAGPREICRWTAHAYRGRRSVHARHNSDE